MEPLGFSFYPHCTPRCELEAVAAVKEMRASLHRLIDEIVRSNTPRIDRSLRRLTHRDPRLVSIGYFGCGDRTRPTRWITEASSVRRIWDSLDSPDAAPTLGNRIVSCRMPGLDRPLPASDRRRFLHRQEKTADTRRLQAGGDSLESFPDRVSRVRIAWVAACLRGSASRRGFAIVLASRQYSRNPPFPSK